MFKFHPAFNRYRSRGQSLVEFAMVAPAFFVLILGIIVLGFFAFGLNSMQFVAQSAVQTASFQGSNPSITYQSAETALSKTIFSGTQYTGQFIDCSGYSANDSTCQVVGCATGSIVSTSSAGCSTSLTCTTPPSKANAVLVCIVEDKYTSSNNTPEITVDVQGWIQNPIYLPGLGNYLPVAASETQSQQSIQCDQVGGGC